MLEQRRIVGSAEACGAGDHGVQHGLEIGWRGTNAQSAGSITVT